MADLFNINIRTGCFCNSGSCQRHLGLTNAEAKEMYKAGHRCGDEVDLLFGKPTGCVRVSFGYYNTYNDVDKLIQMICKCFIRKSFSTPQRLRNTFIKICKTKSVQTHYTNNSLIDKFLNKTRNVIIKDIDHIVPSKSKIHLTEIAIYPIKSCGAFKIHSSWEITKKGLQYDREWMIIKDNGVCLTQKTNTQLCLIIPKIDTKNHLLTLYFPGKFFSIYF